MSDAALISRVSSSTGVGRKSNCASRRVRDVLTRKHLQVDELRASAASGRGPSPSQRARAAPHREIGSSYGTHERVTPASSAQRQLLSRFHRHGVFEIDEEQS